MAGEIDINAYREALVVLGTAGVVVPLVRHFGLSPVLGYLGAGALLGPFGIGGLAAAIPGLSWVSIQNAENVSGIAELGIIFLLFLIGLELSFERLRTMRRLVFGLGTLQIAISSAVIAAGLAILGQPGQAAIILGTALALSSTAIVIEVLSAEQRLATAAGRTSFSVLLAQDLAVIPVLLFIGILGWGPGSSSLLASLASALVKAGLAIAVIVVLGRWLLRPMYRVVAGVESSELFIATTLFIIVGTSLLAAAAGMSMALGAFVAGLLLAETEYRKAIEAEIEPFKGLLLGVFFFTVGMKIDVREVLRDPLLILISVAALIAVKAVIILALARMFRLAWPVALETGLLLGPGGEFAFVSIGAATAIGLIAPPVASFTLAVTALSMALIPVLAVVARRLAARSAARIPPEVLTAVPGEIKQHAIVVGYGRMGTVVADMLERHRFAHIVVETDPNVVALNRGRGRALYYGNAYDPGFMSACGIDKAAAVIVTIHDRAAIDEIVAMVRRLRPDIPIITRARDAAHARHLYAVGVTDAVPETIEASLQLSEAALVGLGLPAGPVIASIHDKRDEFRNDLQQAAGEAGREVIRAIKTRAAGGNR
ncbi:MAG TPA: cation:proton antiporter [Hyphomicrobiaceae bacterium]|nr:cation:proton antiporter [Hyphomicrobiaceae bacterium]